MKYDREFEITINDKKVFLSLVDLGLFYDA